MGDDVERKFARLPVNSHHVGGSVGDIAIRNISFINDANCEPGTSLQCPVCGLDLRTIAVLSRSLHVNACLDGTEPEPRPEPRVWIVSTRPRTNGKRQLRFKWQM